nr:hypothetical protein [Candidatus Freyrarchaeum guaymaensis]
MRTQTSKHSFLKAKAGDAALPYRIKKVKCPECGYEFPKVLPVDCQKTHFLCVHCYRKERREKTS